MKDALLEIVHTHFSAIMGYGFSLIMIVILMHSQRFDSIVSSASTMWLGSVFTYINVKVMGQGAQQPPSPPSVEK